VMNPGDPLSAADLGFTPPEGTFKVQNGSFVINTVDKTTGQEMFHKNNVIKPGMIGMRGAWISGGVEWNSGPQGHTVTIVSPVDALVTENLDGSATLEVSNLEKTLRTRWTVRVTLHPGRAYLDEQIRIFNPVDAVNPYYFWKTEELEGGK
jgi:hypothetical protein